MGIRIKGNILYTLLFADDRVIITGYKEYAIYLFSEVKEQHENQGLTIMNITEYLKAGDNILED